MWMDGCLQIWLQEGYVLTLGFVNKHSLPSGLKWLLQFLCFNEILLFRSRLMMWKLFQTTPTEMMHCSFSKPFRPMPVKYWKLFMVRSENLLMNYCAPCDVVAS